MKKINWQFDFLKFIEECKTKPFSWGEMDCVLFAADCVVLMGNNDPAVASRNKYSTEQGAKKHLKAVYGDLESAWDSKLQRLNNIHFVQNGDVVLFTTDLGPTSGIYWNGGVFATSPDGVRYFDELHNKLTAAWRV